MNRIGVLHIIDTLDIGGAEIVAVNLVNHLPHDYFVPHLCTTRHDGKLNEHVAANVGRLRLQRRYRFDAGAIQRMKAYIREHKIGLLHAHSTSLFVAVIAALRPPHPKVIWHVHSGQYAIKDRRSIYHWLATRRVDGIIAVNQPLVEWAKARLNIAGDRVWYLPNFVYFPETVGDVPNLPGQSGFRIVCVANLRPEKGHLHLIKAMKIVVSLFPDAHLLLVGKSSDAVYYALIQKEITQQGLEQHITLMGERLDVASILLACDIGVVSSVSEGLPLALLEYASAGMAVVSTNVGQCSEVLENGETGLLTPPGDSPAMASALIKLLESEHLRRSLGIRFKARVQETYNVESIIMRMSQIYELVLSESDVSSNQ